MTPCRKAPMQRHEGGYYIRLLALRPSRHRRHHRAAAGAAADLARIDRPASRKPAASPASGARSGEPVPVILITYATTEDAVRKALAAVRPTV